MAGGRVVLIAVCRLVKSILPQVASTEGRGGVHVARELAVVEASRAERSPRLLLTHSCSVAALALRGAQLLGQGSRSAYFSTLVLPCQRVLVAYCGKLSAEFTGRVPG